MPFNVTPEICLRYALNFIKVSDARQERMSVKFKKMVFGWHFGSSPKDIADMWTDLQRDEHPGAFLSVKQNSQKGFKRFVMANYFLWTYPKNAGIFSFTFSICERYCRGEELHIWIRKMAALLPKKIFWDDDLAKDGTSPFAYSVDCTDVRMWEPRAHHEYNVDRKYFSKKHNHGGLKYEIVLSVDKAKCLAVTGPFRAGMHDMTVLRKETKEKLLQAGQKVTIADGIYKPGKGQPNEKELFSIPRTTDDDDLKAFKSRVRSRHESFNGRIKFFLFLQNTFRGTDIAKHGDTFRAICVAVQYQMDNGSPIFSSD